MLGVKRIKNSFIEVGKDYPISMGLVFIATFIYAIFTGKVFFPVSLMLFVSCGTLLCESIHQFKKQDENYSIKDKKYLGLYAVIGIVSLVISWIAALGFKENSYDFNIDFMSFRVLLCYISATISLSLFFFFKNGKESFGNYCIKAFCGAMKAFFVYGVFAISAFLVIWIFNNLIYYIDNYFMTYRIEMLILGFVLYPCMIKGLSSTEGMVSKFSKILFGYIFTGILLVAFAIIYVYIIKIIVTWTFPSNEVFGILTGLFVCGLGIWTMAMGCTDDKVVRYARIMPFLYIPFIVLQIMCLYMRISEYGITSSRYMGIALVIFEIVYFVVYSIGFIRKKDLSFVLLFLLIVVSVTTYLVPGINMFSAVVNSQKKSIEKYFASENKTDSDFSRAYDAFKEIKRDGSLEGEKYIEEYLSAEQVNELQKKSDDYTSYGNRMFSIKADNDRNPLQVDGYSYVYKIEERMYQDDEAYWKSFKADNVRVYDVDINDMGMADLSDITEQMIELHEKGIDRDSEEYGNLIKDPIPLSDGGVLVLDFINISGEYTDNGYLFDGIYFTGYVLK